MISPHEIRRLSGVFTGLYGPRAADRRVGQLQPFEEISRNPIIRHTDAALTRPVRPASDVAHAGADAEVAPLVDELCRSSPEFAAMWRDNEVKTYGEGVKHLRHSVLGPISLEYSAFVVDGRPDLQMIVYNPVTPADQERLRSLIEETPAITAE